MLVSARIMLNKNRTLTNTLLFFAIDKGRSPAIFYNNKNIYYNIPWEEKE